MHSKLVRKSFVASKIKDTVPWTFVMRNLNAEKFAGNFYEKELKKQIKTNTEQKP